MPKALEIFMLANYEEDVATHLVDWSWQVGPISAAYIYPRKRARTCELSLPPPPPPPPLLSSSCRRRRRRRRRCHRRRLPATNHDTAASIFYFVETPDGF